MFISVKDRVTTLNNTIELFNINLQVLNGELDNPNNYSEEYILEVLKKTSQADKKAGRQYNRS